MIAAPVASGWQDWMFAGGLLLVATALAVLAVVFAKSYREYHGMHPRW